MEITCQIPYHCNRSFQSFGSCWIFRDIWIMILMTWARCITLLHVMKRHVVSFRCVCLLLHVWCECKATCAMEVWEWEQLLFLREAILVMIYPILDRPSNLPPFVSYLCVSGFLLLHGGCSKLHVCIISF